MNVGVKNGDFAQHSASTTGDFVFLTDEGHKSSKTKEIYTHVSNKDIGKIKSQLDRLFEKENGGGAKGWMKGRKIEEIGVSSKGMYTRNIANIMPNRSYLRSNADIPKLYAMPCYKEDGI